MERIRPIKSLNDPKEYQALVLENGLKLLLVSDLQCDKAAVSVSVGTGSMSDPDEIPGLAHLCEHLLSLETNSSPGRKPFNSFIAENGGMFNAFTTRDQTNFHFDVDPAVFPEAFERFSRFFTQTPNLTEEHITKEIAIVDAEHSSKVNRDAWRKMAVDATTAKRSHPFYKFTTGNKTTLLEIPKEKGIDVLKAACDFRSQYYVSRMISVVVYGKDTISNLEALCIPPFSQVPDSKGAEPTHWKEWPYGEDQLRRRIDIVPMADIKDFYIVFPIDNTRPYYKTFAHGYLTRLVGNRGPGSLYYYLYEKHWVEYSYISTAVPARGFGELSIGFQLTKIGLDHIDEIILHTFQYIKMLDNNGPQEYFWKEMQRNLYLLFNHQDKEIPVDFVQRLSNLMHVYPLKDVLAIGSIVTDYNPELIQHFMDYLHPDNCRVITVCRRNGEIHETFLQDHWYGGKYVTTEFSEDQLQKWKSCEPLECFHLPIPNKYIPTDFELKCGDKNQKGNHLSLSPKLVLDTLFAQAWFLPDTYFHLAKGVIRFEIFSPFPLLDPISYNQNQIWFLILKNIFSEEFHPASVAGAYHAIKPTLYGVEVTVSGFSHKLIVLIEEIFQRIVSSVEETSMISNYFAPVKDRYFTGLKNTQNLPLQNINTYYLSLLLREKRFSNEELLESMDDVNEETLLMYIRSFFFRVHVEWFTYGNFTEMEIGSLVHSCMEYLKEKRGTRSLLPSQLQRTREVCISEGGNFIYQAISNQVGNSCSLLIQVGLLNRRQSIILEIIDQIIYEPIFTQLRSREQIGYIVRSSIRKSKGCQALLIFVQGDKQPSYMCDRILNAITNVETHLTNMNEKEFSQHKNSVRIRKAEQPKTMLILFDKLWNSEIFTKRYDFMRISKELEELNGITLNEVTTFFREYVSNSSAKRKTLQVHLIKESIENPIKSMADNEPGTSASSSSSVPNSHNASGSSDTTKGTQKSSNYITISNVTNWKSGMCLYPIKEPESLRLNKLAN